MAREATGPRLEPTDIILLNAHGVGMPSKYLYLYSETQLFSTLVRDICLFVVCLFYSGQQSIQRLIIHQSAQNECPNWYIFINLMAQRTL